MKWKLPEKNRSAWLYGSIFAGTLLVWVLVGLIPAICLFRMPNSENMGVFGDFFGVVNSLFSALAFAGVVVAIILQTIELRNQRQEMKETRQVFLDSYYLQAMGVVVNSLDDEHQMKADMQQQLIRLLSLLRNSENVNPHIKAAGRTVAIKRLANLPFFAFISMISKNASPEDLHVKAKELWMELIAIDDNIMAWEISKEFLDSIQTVVAACSLLAAKDMRGINREELYGDLKDKVNTMTAKMARLYLELVKERESYKNPDAPIEPFDPSVINE